ncbi:hypothetical protein EXN66_Car015572 [Channa argus]|uniref:Uncharacterized protein n=1 Tax=Channa argus TaxID=215402 RepID=A0A6G1QBG4_CHAAH|nr:hypothetical protein EXN66_Car015572 [Channa argus]
MMASCWRSHVGYEPSSGEENQMEAKALSPTCIHIISSSPSVSPIWPGFSDIISLQDPPLTYLSSI